MKLQSQLRGDALHIVVDEERIDSAVAIRFKEAVREQAADGPGRVVLDLGRVDFLDSSGLGAVVSVMKLIGPGGKLELCNLTPNVDKVFRLTRMDRVFTIHDSLDSAFPERQGIA